MFQSLFYRVTCLSGKRARNVIGKKLSLILALNKSFPLKKFLLINKLWRSLFAKRAWIIALFSWTKINRVKIFAQTIFILCWRFCNHDIKVFPPLVLSIAGQTSLLTNVFVIFFSQLLFYTSLWYESFFFKNLFKVIFLYEYTIYVFLLLSFGGMSYTYFYQKWTYLMGSIPVSILNHFIVILLDTRA